jgi:drug/metabolite transporter superfamily protein YnfA
MFVLSVGALATTLLVVGFAVERVPLTDAASHRPGANHPLHRRLWASAADRPGFTVAAVALLMSLLGYPFVDAVLRSAGIAPAFEFWDFGAYTQALDRWRTGEPLYVENENGGYDGRYLYPPLFLLAVWPFGQLSFDAGARLWQLCSVVFLWGTLQLVIRELGYRLRLWERGLLLWALVGFHPVLLSVKQGQVSAFLAGLLTLSLYGILVTMRTRHRATAAFSGAYTGAVGVVKLVYAPVGAHLLTDRRRFLGALGTGVALVGLSVAVFGVDSNLAYVDVLLWGKEDDVRTPLLWLPPYFRPLYGFGDLSIPIRAVGCVAVAGLALVAPREASRETFVMGVAAMPLLAPRAYTYYLTALVPAVVAMLAVELETGGRPTLPLVACILLHTHSYGLKLVGWAVPQLVSGPETAMPVLDATAVGFVVSLLQPGVLGAVLLGSLAAVRVGEAVTFQAISLGFDLHR